MTLPSSGPAADAVDQPSPWDELAPDGDQLVVTDFLTTLVVNTGNALRRHVTLQYARQFGLSMSEWRVLSVLAHARELPFAELVVGAATDKGQLSRMLRAMEERGLLTLRGEGAAPRRKVTCVISPQGLALYEQVMPIARRRQAEMILQMSVRERRALYGALNRLRSLCQQAGDDDAD